MSYRTVRASMRAAANTVAKRVYENELKPEQIRTELVSALTPHHVPSTHARESLLADAIAHAHTQLAHLTGA